MPLNIFFDVDYTIQGDDGSLRPGVRETFEALVADGHTIVVWSAIGERWDDLRRHGLLELVSAVHRKPLYQHHERLSELGITLVPDFVIDDSPDIVDAFGGLCVEAYSASDAADREMERVLRVVAAWEPGSARAVADRDDRVVLGFLDHDGGA